MKNLQLKGQPYEIFNTLNLGNKVKFQFMKRINLYSLIHEDVPYHTALYYIFLPKVQLPLGRPLARPLALPLARPPAPAHPYSNL
jgi:hypothetical protein